MPDEMNDSLNFARVLPEQRRQLDTTASMTTGWWTHLGTSSSTFLTRTRNVNKSKTGMLGDTMLRLKATPIDFVRDEFCDGIWHSICSKT
jgi:hypothetical protein